MSPCIRATRRLIGIGGIGSGTFFALNGNHTLGREESRGGRFLDRRDYCKLHIISHYVRPLLGGRFCRDPGRQGRRGRRGRPAARGDGGGRARTALRAAGPKGGGRCSPCASSIPTAAAAT